MAGPEALGREYILHEEIGRDALAVVRRATSRFGGPPLAAKLLKPEYAEDQRVRESFIREEATLRDFEHPSVVGIRDLVVEGDRLALLTDYVDAPNLSEYVARRGGSLPVAEATWIGAQVAAALAVAHVQGVVHLDLKPEDIMVVRDTDPARIRISGFGVAALLLDAGHAVTGGTAGHIAPEMRHGGPATAAADVYSLGVVLRTMLGGDLPEPLSDLVSTCLAADPRTRPSARAVAVKLRAFRTAATSAATTAAAPSTGTPRDGRTPGGGVAALRPPAGPARWRHGPLITLTVGVVVAAVLAGVNVNVAADQRTASGPPAIPTITAETRPPPTTTPQSPPSKPPTVAVADRTRATFAGHVDDGAGTLAISLRDGVAIAYICDGERVEAWLKGTAANGELSLTGKGGAKIAATFTARGAKGKVTVEGETHTFDIGIAKKPSGLYRTAKKVRNAEVVGSWIVLPDGKQVGVLTDGGVPGPAPALDLAARTTVVDGTEISASTIDVDSGAGF